MKQGFDIETISFNDVRDALLAGAFDKELGRLVDLIRARKDIIGMSVIATASPGDKVRIKDIRPKKLIGQIATVVSANQKTLTVTLDNASLLGPRFMGKVKVPVVCVELVNG